MAIKIISLNIEGDKHVPDAIGLIGRERPDVICLQEVFEDDFNIFVDRMKMRGIFSPMVFVDRPGRPGFRKRGIFGVAMMSRLPGTFASAYYFKRRSKELPRFGGNPNAGHRALVWQKIDDELTVSSTHFTWSKNGQATNKQRRELNGLMKLLVVRVRPDVLCGDFNAPRGGEIWARLAEKFIDNIPVEIKTTLDPARHYANGVRLVVDGFFTPAPRRVRGSVPMLHRDFTLPNNEVRVKSLRLIDGVSDHLAIIAQINQRPII